MIMIFLQKEKITVKFLALFTSKDPKLLPLKQIQSCTIIAKICHNIQTRNANDVNNNHTLKSTGNKPLWPLWTEY